MSDHHPAVALLEDFGYGGAHAVLADAGFTVVASSTLGALLACREAAAGLAEAVEALWPFVRHAEVCPRHGMIHRWTPPCTCGSTDACAHLRAALEEFGAVAG